MMLMNDVDTTKKELEQQHREILKKLNAFVSELEDIKDNQAVITDNQVVLETKIDKLDGGDYNGNRIQ